MTQPRPPVTRIVRPPPRSARQVRLFPCRSTGIARPAIATRALVTTNPKLRKALYQKIQTQLNQRGPYFPLIQPTQVFVSTTDLNNAVFNATYAVDVTRVTPK